MSEVKHTPPPWELDNITMDDTDICLEARDPATGRFTRIAFVFHDGYDEGAENAQFIVRAVNSHADLLAACEAARAAISAHVLGTILGYKPIPGAEAEITRVVDLLRAAIAKARGPVT